MLFHPLRDLAYGQVLNNPTPSDLRRLASGEEHTTSFGAPSYRTRIRSRSAKDTYVVPGGFAPGNQQVIDLGRAAGIMQEVIEYLKTQELIRVDRLLGRGEASMKAIPCAMLVTKDSARLALMWHKSLFARDGGNFDILSVHVPEWPQRIILVDPEAAVTLILGTDYFGETKKSFLRMAMYLEKNLGRLGVHAGSKVLRVRRKPLGSIQPVGVLLFGLSGTGKTTLTVHDHFLSGDESVTIRQDDVVILDSDARAYGTENSFYIKTEGLDSSQTALYEAACHPDAILENVMVHQDGGVDFGDSSLTSNGRAVIPRHAVKASDDSIDLERVDAVFFITRRQDILGPVALLDSRQAACFFMLGESIETSAGDPTKAGQSKREVGTNPFIIGPEAEEGNRFLRFLQQNPEIQCFLLNTGSVGPVSIDVTMSANIIREIARGTVSWKDDPVWGYRVPLDIPGIDLETLDPLRYFSPGDYRERVKRLKEERTEWLSRFQGLEAGIGGMP